MPKTPFPLWLRKRTPHLGLSLRIDKLLKETGLHTVCQSAKCPNLLECFSKGTTTFLIMGDVCTRQCRFCVITYGSPVPLDKTEPARIARAVSRLKLKHAVITSVTRDDLSDGGSLHFAETIRAIRETSPEVIIEVLTSDFQGSNKNIQTVIQARPDIFNHNVETAPRLYALIRPQANYQRSLRLLKLVKRTHPEMVTKSGLLLGLGETEKEVLGVMKDLRKVDCDMITLGQYLRPSLNPKNIKVARYVPPEEFARYKQKAEALGFRSVASGPYVRSSYGARELFSQKTS